MNYLSERQKIKLEQVKDQLPAELKYLIFKGYHKTDSSNINGVIFRVFDDQITLVYTSIDSKTIKGDLKIEIIDNFYTNNESNKIISRIVSDLKITEIADVITGYYFD